MNRLNRSVTLLLASTALTLTAAALSCAQASDCGAVTLEQGRVVQVIDARTLRLADGREIRLDGIEIPSVDAAAAKFKGMTSPGVRFVITDARAYRPVRTALILIDQIKRLVHEGNVRRIIDMKNRRRAAT